MSARGKVRRSLLLTPYKVNYGFGKKSAGVSAEKEIVEIDPPEEEECPRESHTLTDVRSTGNIQPEPAIPTGGEALGGGTTKTSGPQVVKKVPQLVRLAPGWLAKNAGKLGIGKKHNKKKHAMQSGSATTSIAEPESTTVVARTQPVAPVVTDAVAPVVT